MLSAALFTGTARAGICLPPIFEGGRRLVFHEIEVGGIDLLLRQHEVCWRSPRATDEQRVFVFGNSAMFGYPHAADDSAIEVLNRRFEAEGVRAHLFNLGFVLSYNLKEMLILHEALRYEPDVIVFSSMLDDFVHVAPLRYKAIFKFFGENSRAVERFADESPRGLAEPFALWRDAQKDEARRLAAWRSLRDAGSLVRVAARNWARDARQQLFPDMPLELPEIGPKRNYDCQEAIVKYRRLHKGWQEWNPLAYLEQVREQTGAEILVVSWPAAHDPKGPCFNLRYTVEALAEYRRWIAAEARSRHFHFVDLQDEFPQDAFIDSVHPTVAGQAAIARLIEPHLRQALAASRRAGGTPASTPGH